MTRRMLIDASQSEETRVVVLHGNRLEEFDYDSESKKQLKGNVYLAKVTRVEPSLQAAFVEYGGNRHGFLAFNEIHPDYYKIPVADREQLLADEAAEVENDESDEDENVETVGGDELEEVDRRRRRQRRHYKIQEVTKRGQVLLVQVVKEERGNKGAALTTYLSLPGRYCVLMPNTGRGGGISRKISNARDRKRLKTIVDDLGIPKGMAVIVRTAGSERTKAELKRDFEYLMRLWTQIRDDTLKSSAPSLIYEEANLIKRAIRDMYTKDIEDVLVEGDEGYKTAKGFMRTLMPSHAKRVQPYKSDGVPVFQRYQVEGQIDAIHNPEVKLRSGGYIVMHQTEALVAIDVNSGRATRERHIEETAAKTNLEAAEEVARQLRLRDLAGLIVIDFIDMEESRNNHAVERKLKDALRFDRARIQVGRISHFGLMEMSRQRLRPSLMEISSEICHYCGGSGYIQSVEWSGLHILRAIEEEALRRRAVEISVTMPADAALYLLNHKRAKLSELETRYELKILIVADSNMVAPNFNLDIVRAPGSAGSERSALTSERIERVDDGAQERPGRRRRRGRKRRPQDEDATVETAEEEESDEIEETEAVATPDNDEETEPRRRKRGRRGGRRRGRRGKGTTENSATGNATEDGAPDGAQQTAEHAEDGNSDRADTYSTADSAESGGDEDEPAQEATADAIAEDDTQAEEKPKAARKRPRRRRKPAAAAPADAATADVEDAGQAPQPMSASEEVNGAEIGDSVEPAPIELYEEPVAAIPAEEISAGENGANGNDESHESRDEISDETSDDDSDAEPAAVTAERQTSKKSGWWNRNW